MPATSKKQQRLFGMLDSIRKGEMKNPPENLKRLAYSMPHKSIQDFAKTKHTNLPDQVTKEKVASYMAEGFVKAAMQNGLTEKEAQELVKEAWLPILANAARFLPALGGLARGAGSMMGGLGKGLMSAGRGAFNFLKSPFGLGLQTGAMIPGPGLTQNANTNQEQPPRPSTSGVEVDPGWMLGPAGRRSN